MTTTNAITTTKINKLAERTTTINGAIGLVSDARTAAWFGTWAARAIANGTHVDTIALIARQAAQAGYRFFGR